jgi:hypothetical protein
VTGRDEHSDLPSFDDPSGWILSQEGRFFRSGRCSPLELTTLLVADALLLGGESPVTAHRYGDWWIVASDADWIAGSALPVQELFSRIVPLPESGPNSMRAEVLVRTFAEDVVTGDPAGNLTVLKGDRSGSRDLLTLHVQKRWVAFRCTSEGASAQPPS